MTNEIKLEKLLIAFIDASGYEIEDTQNVFIKGVEQKGCGSLIPIDADNIDYLEVVNDYKVTKKPFDILSEEYTDEMERLHRVIYESNTYNKELYLENYELKKEIATLKTGKAFNENI